MASFTDNRFIHANLWPYHGDLPVNAADSAAEGWEPDWAAFDDFVLVGGETSRLGTACTKADLGAYWVDSDTLYTADYQRGVDILTYDDSMTPEQTTQVSHPGTRFERLPAPATGLRQLLHRFRLLDARGSGGQHGGVSRDAQSLTVAVHGDGGAVADLTVKDLQCHTVLQLLAQDTL